MARQSCAEWGITCAELELVVSELVTNAVRHATSDIDLAITYCGRVVRVEVSDDSPEVPQRRDAAPADRSGRGLAIVESLTSGWWVDVGVDGRKSIGAELPCGRGTEGQPTSDRPS